jgi:predicted transcriptional regulator of viral defense system
VYNVNCDIYLITGSTIQNMVSKGATQKALAVFEEHHGLLGTSQAIRLGIAPRTLYSLRDEGVITEVNRGLFRLTAAPPLSHPDLTQVAIKVPKGVICLISALAFHGLTTQVPHEVYLALPNDAEKPRLAYPPLRLFWLTDKVYASGIEEHKLDGVPVRIYSVEKTVADCFKFRRKIGLDVVLEALKQAVAEERIQIDKLLDFARLDRVERVMRPYLEVLL